MALPVIYSSHARKRMVLRGISRGEVEAAIHLGAKTRQGNRIVAAYRHLSVIYAVRGNRIVVVKVTLRW